MDKNNFPSIYRNSRSEAERLGETELWWESFHNNVACARHIEAAIRGYFDDTSEQLKPGCAESVLAVWGATRVNLVLANTLQDVPSHLRHLYSGENLEWGGEAQPLLDSAYRRYYVADSGAGLVDSFITQTRELCATHFEKELSMETSEDVQAYVGVTVESFLRNHPNAALNIMSPDGYICLTPEDGQALLNGGEVFAHPGNPEYAVKVSADMILCQQISSIGLSDADDPNFYNMLTSHPEPDECMEPEIGPQGMGMTM